MVAELGLAGLPPPRAPATTGASPSPEPAHEQPRPGHHQRLPRGRQRRRHRPPAATAREAAGRLFGAPRAAHRAATHGRPVDLFRPHGPGRLRRGPGHRCAAAPAHRPGHGDLPLRGRDPASRLAGQRAGHPPRRYQPDGLRPRHRAFRARNAAAARASAPARRPATVAGPARRRRGGRAGVPALPRRRHPQHPRQRRAAAGDDGRGLWPALAGAHLCADALRRGRACRGPEPGAARGAGARGVPGPRQRADRRRSRARARAGPCCTPGPPPCCAPAPRRALPSSAVRRWAGVTSSGTSCPHGPTALPRPSATGPAAASRACLATAKSSSCCRADRGRRKVEAWPGGGSKAPAPRAKSPGAALHGAPQVGLRPVSGRSQARLRAAVPPAPHGGRSAPSR